MSWLPKYGVTRSLAPLRHQGLQVVVARKRIAQVFDHLRANAAAAPVPLAVDPRR